MKRTLSTSNPQINQKKDRDSQWRALLKTMGADELRETTLRYLRLTTKTSRMAEIACEEYQRARGN